MCSRGRDSRRSRVSVSSVEGIVHPLHEIRRQFKPVQSAQSHIESHLRGLNIALRPADERFELVTNVEKLRRLQQRARRRAGGHPLRRCSTLGHARNVPCPGTFLPARQHFWSIGRAQAERSACGHGEGRSPCAAVRTPMRTLRDCLSGSLHERGHRRESERVNAGSRPPDITPIMHIMSLRAEVTDPSHGFLARAFGPTPAVAGSCR